MKGVFNSNIASFSYVGVCALIVVGYVFVVNKNRKDSYKIVKEITLYVSIIILSAIFMFLMYSFVLSECEAPYLPSLGRYLGTSIVAIIVVMLFNVSRIENQNNYFRTLTCIILISLVLSNGYNSFRNLVMTEDVENSFGKNSFYGRNAARKCRDVVGENDAIYYISSKKANADDYLAYRYYMAPSQFNSPVVSDKSGASSLYQLYPVTEGRAELEYTIDEDSLKDRISKFDYVMLEEIDDRFILSYGAMFADVSCVLPNSLYKVSENGILEYVFSY